MARKKNASGQERQELAKEDMTPEQLAKLMVLMEAAVNMVK